MKSIGLFFIVILFLFGTANAERAVWYVHPDSALNTIQAGLDSCADNDVVLVAPGIYYENIVWPGTHGIHLVSELGPDTTIIDGDSTGRVIHMAYYGIDSTTVVRGFTIRNGFAGAQYGAGIYMTGGSSPVIAGNVISNNSAIGAPGGGVCCSLSNAVITQNQITNNLATFGAGIYCSDGSSTTIAFNDISYNAVANDFSLAGAGICCFACNATVTSNRIHHNTVPGSMNSAGGGIACQILPGSGYSIKICGNTIDSNFCAGVGFAIGGGGVAADGFGGGSVIICDNTIIDNDGGSAYGCGNGGGIYCLADSVIIRDNLIANNIAGHGGGIGCNGDGILVVDNSIVENVASDLDISGGGIYCGGVPSNFRIDSCCIAYNIGDGIWYMHDVTIAIDHCDIVHNIGYAVRNFNPSGVINAEYNWWGDATGPYHPLLNPAGLGDTVSDSIDFNPWLSHPVGIEEQPFVKLFETQMAIRATIFSGPLQLPKGRKCKVFDITGRAVEPKKIVPGIYFIEVDGVVTQKVVKVR